MPPEFPLALLVTTALAGSRYDFERPADPADGTRSPEQLLRLELARVAAPRAFDLCQRSAEVLRMIQAGDIEPLVESTRVYTVDPAGQWRTYTRTWLAETRAKLAGFAFPEHPYIATLVAPPDVAPPPPGAGSARDGCHLGIVAADPERGMPPRAYAGFGPDHAHPAGSESEGPVRLTVGWYWLGQVMPEPNDALHEAPAPDRPGPGAWYLAGIAKPWSSAGGLEQ